MCIIDRSFSQYVNLILKEHLETVEKNKPWYTLLRCHPWAQRRILCPLFRLWQKILRCAQGWRTRVGRKGKSFSSSVR